MQMIENFSRNLWNRITMVAINATTIFFSKRTKNWSLSSGLKFNCPQASNQFKWNSTTINCSSSIFESGDSQLLSINSEEWDMVLDTNDGQIILQSLGANLNYFLWSFFLICKRRHMSKNLYCESITINVDLTLSIKMVNDFAKLTL